MIVELVSDGVTLASTRGMPMAVMKSRAFNTDHHVQTIRSESEGYSTRRVARSKQVAWLESVLASPFSSNYLFVVASNPTEEKGILAAAAVFTSAMVAYTTARPHGTEPPLWHRIYGGFNDSVRELARTREDGTGPALLVLSNVEVSSSASKIETLRDIVTAYDFIPRVVVISGCDPIDFSRQRLRINPDYCLNLTTMSKTEV